MPLLQDYNKLFEHTDNIKKVYVNNNVVWPAVISSTPPGPDYTEPFYVENITNANETLKIKKSRPAAPTLTIEYSTDRTTWQTLCTTTTSGYTQTLQPGEKIYLRCSTNAWSALSNGFDSIVGISKIGGNVMSLLYGNNFTGQETSFPDTTLTFILNGTFYQNTHLIDAHELLLPVTTLNRASYTSLFRGCTLLTTAPDLPATTLVQSCYSRMFQDCTSLNYVKCLATSGINTTNCNSWLSGVSSTGTFTKAAGVTWPTGESGIPTGWTVIEV